MLFKCTYLCSGLGQHAKLISETFVNHLVANTCNGSVSVKCNQLNYTMVISPFGHRHFLLLMLIFCCY